MPPIRLTLITAVCLLLVPAFSCNPINLYEKSVAIPKHRWETSFKPEFRFQVSDTLSEYQLYITLRHNARYNYNNIWLNLHVQDPSGTVHRFTEIEMPLASRSAGKWLGSGMGDVYDQRIGLTLDPSRFRFNQQGLYIFTIEHIMREDPLQNVMNVGLRLEKK